MKPYLDVDWLKANHTMIHYFGLGFIQVKIDRLTRMHFYIPGLEPIVPEEDVHNHRYDFESMIVGGSLTQELFSFAPSRWPNGPLGGYVIEEVSCEEGATPERSLGTFDAWMNSRHMYSRGSSYLISHEQFHRVIPSSRGCITLVKRSDYRKALAQVMKPLKGRSVCPFSKKIPEVELWELVAEALQIQGKVRDESEV